MMTNSINDMQNDGVSALDAMSIDDIKTMDLDSLLADDTPASKSHYANLLDDDSIDFDFNRLGTKVIAWKREDESSREEWIFQEKAALKALGISKEARDPRYPGATTATHPLFIEAVEKFHNRALVELRPPNGNIVKSEVVGYVDDAVQGQAYRVEDYMNYVYKTDMPDEFSEMDKLLFRLPISGSCFKDLYYCERRKKYFSVFVPPEDMIVPWNAADLETADRFIRRHYESHATYRRNVASGFYIDESKNKPGNEEVGELRQVALDSDGTAANSTADVNQHQILCCYCSLDIEEGYDYPMEYAVWVEAETSKVIRVQRNWKPNDDQHSRIVRTVHYQYAKGLGFYGLGIYHLLNGTIDASTDIIRTMIDGSIEASFGGIYVSRQAKIPMVKGQAGKGRNGVRPPPNTITEIDSSPDDLSKAFFVPPVREPSSTLMNTLEHIDRRGQEAIGTNGILSGEPGMSNMPVGTVLALIEQSSIQFSAIFQRLHNAQTKEFRILADIIAENIPDTGYPYSTKGGADVVMASDFDERIDIFPVSSPDSASKSHRIMQANAITELSLKFGGLLNPKWVLEQTFEAMRINVPDDAWAKQQQAEPDPLQLATIEKLKAETAVKVAELDKIKAESTNIVAEKANTNADTQFSLVNTAALAVQNAEIMPLAAQLGDIAGYVDESVYQLDGVGAGLDDGVINETPVVNNTHPQFPPNVQGEQEAQPLDGIEPAMPDLPSPDAGINTPSL